MRVSYLSVPAMALRRDALSLLLALSFVGCTAAEPGEPVPDEPESPGGKADSIDDVELPTRPPRRIILLIGDGMGVAALTAGAYASKDLPEAMSMPQVGFMTTHEHEYVTTDSAASATAMASGVKTHFNGVGVAPGTTKDDENDETTHVTSIIDVAKEAGWKTGLVSTTSIVDATPAAFGAHRATRKSKDDIALDLRHSGVDVLIGGGRKFFEDHDEGDLLVDMREEDGYSISKTRLGLKRASGKKERVVGLLHESDMPPVTTGERAMELPDLVREAIEILDTNNDEGFFLMVEGAQIDRREHELDGPGTAAEAVDFLAAVDAALEYARGRDDTLVVVTADHETSGLVVLDPPTAEPYVDALGGEDEAHEAADYGAGFAKGAKAFELTGVGDHALVGPSVEDRELLLSFGDMSLASRPFWFGPSFAFRGAHTPVMVPLLAEGPGAEFAATSTDNAQLGTRLQTLVDEAAAIPVGDEPAPEEAPEPGRPEHLVVFVTDLAGLPAITATHYHRGALETLGLPVRGLVAPGSGDRIVPDATAAAAALAQGELAMVGEPSSATSLLQAAESAGKVTGLVTTGALDAPLAAAFYAGTGDAPIAALVGMVEGDGVDVVFGGGRDAVSDALLDQWEASGATVSAAWTDDAPADDGADVRLIGEGALDPAIERLAGDSEHPELAEMVGVALDGLTSHQDGSVLVVLADGPAQRLADHDHEPLVDEMLDLDAAVAAALEHEGVTVVVTSARDATTSVLDNHYGFHASHCGVTARCGGPEMLIPLALAAAGIPSSEGFDDEELQGEFTPPVVFLQSSWLTFRAHAAGGVPESASAHFVPLFASGPGARALSGFRTQVALGQQLLEWAAD